MSKGEARCSVEERGGDDEGGVSMNEKWRVDEGGGVSMKEVGDDERGVSIPLECAKDPRSFDCKNPEQSGSDLVVAKVLNICGKIYPTTAHGGMRRYAVQEKYAVAREERGLYERKLLDNPRLLHSLVDALVQTGAMPPVVLNDSFKADKVRRRGG